MDPQPNPSQPPIQDGSKSQLAEIGKKFASLPASIKLTALVGVCLLFAGTGFGLVSMHQAPSKPKKAHSSNQQGNSVTLQTTTGSGGTSSGSSSSTQKPSNKTSAKKNSSTSSSSSSSSSGGSTNQSSSKSGSSGSKSSKSGGSGGSKSGGSGGSTWTTELAIPTYWYPPASYDSQLTAAASHVGFVIANINSGPGTGGAESNFQTMINNERSADIKVYGYVYTQYGSRSISDVESDIANWYSWYNLDGILLDEAPGTGWTNAQKTYYQTLYNYIKAESGVNVHGKTVVLNPGTVTDQYAMSVSDIISDYEDVESNYASATVPSWASQYPASRFWNIVYDSAGVSQMESDIALAKSRNVGYVDVTTESGGNPYDGLPSDPFWTDELNDL